MGADIISFFVASEGKKIQKIDKNNQNRRSKNLYLLGDLMNFNKIFEKNVTYDDIKNDQKQSFTLSSGSIFIFLG